MNSALFLAALLALGPQPLRLGQPRVEIGQADFTIRLVPGVYAARVAPRGGGDARLEVRSDTPGFRASYRFVRGEGDGFLPLVVSREEGYRLRVECAGGYEILVEKREDSADSPARETLWRPVLPGFARLSFGIENEIWIDGLNEATFYVPNAEAFEVRLAPVPGYGRLGWATLEGMEAPAPERAATDAEGIRFRVTEVLERWYRLRMGGEGKIRIMIRSLKGVDSR